MALFEHSDDARSADFSSVLDEAIGQLTARIEVLNRKQKELETSLMSLKEMRASVAELPETATRAILDALLRQAGVSVEQRLEVMNGLKGPITADDEDGPACAEQLSPAESLTNYQKIVKYFLSRKNAPAANLAIREAIRSSRGAVAQVLYTTHADKFERLKTRLLGKVAWKLRDEIYRSERLAAIRPEAETVASEKPAASPVGQEEEIPF